MIFTTKPTYVTSRNIYNFSFETLTAEKLCTTRVQPYSYCMFLCDGKFKKDFLLHEMRCESHLGVSHLGMPNNIKTTCSDRSLQSDKLWQNAIGHWSIFSALQHRLCVLPTSTLGIKIYQLLTKKLSTGFNISALEYQIQVSNCAAHPQPICNVTVKLAPLLTKWNRKIVADYLTYESCSNPMNVHYSAWQLVMTWHSVRL